MDNLVICCYPCWRSCAVDLVVFAVILVDAISSIADVELVAIVAVFVSVTTTKEI